MASIRRLKNDVDYLISEVISDCYLRLYFNPDRKREEVLNVMREAANFRNEMFDRINNPAEKNNKHLVKKHYASIRRDMMTKVDDMFDKLSATCK